MWIHGELETPDGKVHQFRYENMAPDEIGVKIMKGSRIIWWAEGFIPEDTTDWGDWTMAEPGEFDELGICYLLDSKD